jgi:hypothetical protein
MDENELVMELGSEGGGARIFRTEVASDGWQFHAEGSSMFLDDKDDENWRLWSCDPVPTIQDALRSIAEDGSWVFLYPISVHPEYRKVVWELAQEIASKLSAESSKMWQHEISSWQSICMEKG